MIVSEMSDELTKVDGSVTDDVSGRDGVNGSFLKQYGVFRPDLTSLGVDHQ